MHAENNSNQQAMQNSSIVKIVASSSFADGSVLLSQIVCVYVYMVKYVALPRYIRTLFVLLSGRYEWKLKSFKHIWRGTTIQTIALFSILFSCTNIGDFTICRALQKLYIEMVKFFVWRWNLIL